MRTERSRPELPRRGAAQGSPAPPRWPVRAALAGILLVGGLLRAAYFHDLEADPLYRAPALDAELHDYWATGLATGDWTLPKDRPDPKITTTPYFRPPGYPYLLAAIYELTGTRPAPTRTVQFALGLLGGALTFALARRYAGAAAGLVAAALYVTSWVLIFFEGELLDAFLLAVLTPALLLGLRIAADRGGTLAPLVAGAGIGLFALVRPNGLALLPALAFWLVWARRGLGTARDRWRAGAAVLAGGLLTIAPAAIRNQGVSGEWIPISSNAGINLHIGNNPKADGIRAGIPDLEELAGISGWTCFEYPLLVEGLGRKVGRPLSYGEASRLWAAEARRWIADNPGRFLALSVKRAALLFGPREIGDRDLDLTREASTVLRRLPGRFPWYLAAALTGIAFLAADHRRNRGTAASASSRERMDTAVLLSTFVVVYAATFVPFFVNARYRVPVLVVLFVLAADAVVRTVRLLQERRWRTAAWACGLFLAVGAASSWDPTGYRPDRGEWHYQRGNANRNAGNAAAAVSEYEAAIRESPHAVPPRRDLALVLRDGGRTEEALALLAAALVIDPHASEARFDRAQILASSGRFGEAAVEYERVLADAPRNPHAHLSLGTALLQLGRVPEALAHYREAESLAPSDPLVAYVVGRGLLATGRAAEAIVPLRRAVALSPGFEPARRALEAAERAGRTGP